MPRFASFILAALLFMSAASSLSCDRDESPPPQPATYELQPTAVPGEQWTIAEVTTIERTMRQEGLEVLEDTEIGRQFDVAIQQVDPDGQPIRYEKTFRRFRVETSTRLLTLPDGSEPPAPPDGESDAIDVSADVHPLEGKTIEYVWRSDHWDVTGGGDEAQSRESRHHPWLPEKPVAVGERWTTQRLPFVLPGITEDDVKVTLELSDVETRERPAHTERFARVEVVVDIGPEGDPDDASKPGTGESDEAHFTGKLAGFDEFRLADNERPARIMRLQLSGELQSPTETIRLVTFRGAE